MLAEVDELERKAKAAEEEADRKAADLQAIWDECQEIPVKIERINERLNPIANDLASLDTAKLEDDFPKLYRATPNGALTDPLAQMQFAGLLVTAPLRKEVLNSLAEELQTQLADLKARHRALSRKLGQPSTI